MSSSEALVDRCEKTVLPSGVRVLVDPCPHFVSVSVALLLVGGSRDEEPEEIGLTHLLEHLLLKRTKNRSPLEIAALIDRLGGEVNAYTDTDGLCLHGSVRREDFSVLLDFFAELLFEESFLADDLSIEKEIVRQEILDSDDDPEQVVYEKFGERFWSGSMLSKPVFGTLESVASFDESMIRNRLKTLLKGNRIIISVAGPISIEEVVKVVEKNFSSLELGDEPKEDPVTTTTGIYCFEKQLSQCYVGLGFPWPHIAHKDYLGGLIISSLFGGGMSSRLFQRIREERGLTYDVQSDVDSHRDVAALYISATTERANLDETIALIGEEALKLMEHPLREKEVSRAIGYLDANAQMSTDSIDGRMWRMLETEYVFGKYISIAEVSNRLKSYTADSLTKLMQQWSFEGAAQMVVSGELGDFTFPSSIDLLCNPRVTQ